MNLATIFITSFIVGFSGALSPGPLLSITIAHSIQKGFKAGPLIVLGHAILEFFMLILILFGIINFIKNNFYFKLIFLLGGIILIVMGIEFIIKNKKFVISDMSNNRIIFNPVIDGIFVSLSNPYWIIWWLTIGAVYVLNSAKFGAIGILLFFIAHILSDFSWYSFISFTFSKGKKFINKNLYDIIILFCGLALLFLGFWFLIEGVVKKKVV